MPHVDNLSSRSLQDEWTIGVQSLAAVFIPPLPLLQRRGEAWGGRGTAMKQKLWGGGFEKAPEHRAWTFGQSVQSDLTFWSQEIQVSIAHAKMLGATGVITQSEASALVDGLESVYGTFVNAEVGADGTKLAALLSLVPDAEAIHAVIETLLKEKAGDVADKLHSGRSRNDQVSTSARLWLRDGIWARIDALRDLHQILVELAEKHKADAMPGFTHMQSAQPVTLGFHLLAYFWMLQRDVVRLQQLEHGLNECPLGSAAPGRKSLPLYSHPAGKG